MSHDVFSSLVSFEFTASVPLFVRDAAGEYRRPRPTRCCSRPSGCWRSGCAAGPRCLHLRWSGTSCVCGTGRWSARCSPARKLPSGAGTGRARGQTRLLAWPPCATVNWRRWARTCSSKPVRPGARCKTASPPAASIASPSRLPVGASPRGWTRLRWRAWKRLFLTASKIPNPCDSGCRCAGVLLHGRCRLEQVHLISCGTDRQPGLVQQMRDIDQSHGSSSIPFGICSGQHRHGQDVRGLGRVNTN